MNYGEKAGGFQVALSSAHGWQLSGSGGRRYRRKIKIRSSESSCPDCARSVKRCGLRAAAFVGWRLFTAKRTASPAPAFGVTPDYGSSTTCAPGSNYDPSPLAFQPPERTAAHRPSVFQPFGRTA